MIFVIYALYRCRMVCLVRWFYWPAVGLLIANGIDLIVNVIVRGSRDKALLKLMALEIAISYTDEEEDA